MFKDLIETAQNELQVNKDDIFTVVFPLLSWKDGKLKVFPQKNMKNIINS